MEYTKESAKDFLLSVKHLCDKRVCFRKMDFDEQIKDLYQGTMEMVDDALHKDEIDQEQISAITSNMLLLFTNAADCMEKAKQNQQKEVTITSDIVVGEAEKACRFIDKKWKISQRYKAFKAREEKQKKKSTDSVFQRRRRIVERILVSGIVICVIIAFSGLFIPDRAEAAVSESILDKLKKWYRFKLRKEEVPTPFIQIWMSISQTAGYLSIVALITQLILWLKNLRMKKREYEVRNNWKEYQSLRNAFAEAEELMKQWEW